MQTKGYQLFDASKIATKSAGGATVTNNGDGSFTISGSGNLTGNFVNSHVLSNEEAKKLFKAGRVTLKGDKTYPFVYMQIKNTAGLIKELKTLDVDSERYLDLTSEHINSEGFHVSFGICGSSGSAIIPGTVKPMVYQDGDGTWEPFTDGKPSPSMEYKQDPESSGDGGEINVNVGEENTQHLSIQTPNGLPGIKVDSGGNYTDSNGQQWVCDEMDFGRGKYVQRIKKVVFNGSEDWNLESISQKGFANFYVRNLSGIRANSNVLSNQFRNQTTVISETTEEGIANLSTLYVRIDKTKADNANKFKEILKTNNLEICYQLATPIETDIPEETMTAYRKLYTNYPSTVVQNDSGAGMEVEYATYTCRANKEDVKDLVDRIEDLQSYVGYYTDNHVVGLQVDYKNKTFKRLAGAKYLKPGADFDKYKMFGGRRKCIVEDSGKIVAWHGDKNYTEDGSLGQVMVYQPAFYYRVQPLELDPIDTGIGHHLRKANYYVSDIPSPGFKRHPAFYDANGNEIDYFLTSAYEGSIWDADGDAYLLQDEQVMNAGGDKFSSISGARPASGSTQGLTRTAIEQMAQNRGTNWHGDLIKQVSAEQMLMIIEMGMMNLQTAIAQGVVTLPLETGSDKTSSYAAVTGSTSGIGNGTGRAERTTTYEGGVAKEYTVDGKTSVCWRGKENFWGNIWKFVYGINICGNGKMGAVSLTFVLTSTLLKTKIAETMRVQDLQQLMLQVIFQQWDILQFAIGYL